MWPWCTRFPRQCATQSVRWRCLPSPCRLICDAERGVAVAVRGGGFKGGVELAEEPRDANGDLRWCHICTQYRGTPMRPDFRTNLYRELRLVITRTSSST